MDKRKVISAYRRGFLTIQECAQILGVSTAQAEGIVTETNLSDRSSLYVQPANS
jgi:hypothetical protein